MPEKAVCQECGMPVRLGEYHPFAACLMYKGCHDGDVVRKNLEAITFEWRGIGRREHEHSVRRMTGPG